MTGLKKLALGAALSALTVGGVMATTTAPADARVVVGFGIGVPWAYPAYPYYPGCYGYYCGYPGYYGYPASYGHYGYPGWYGGGWAWAGGRWVWRGGFRGGFRDGFSGGFGDRDRGFHGGGFHASATHVR
ncbi:MAG TPA: hypothetical protein VF835_07000 [Rhizomicrobium sp.]